MTLFVHRGQGTETLADGLAELLAGPVADPFAEEVVAVPAKGVERWLAQRLSHHLGAGAGEDGVCAGVRFLTPHSLVAMVLGVERDDAWRPEQLAWPVLRAVDVSLGEPWAATLAGHLGSGLAGTEGELRRGRRYAVARRLAGLFAQYAAQRPAMVADWRDGGSGDGLGGAIPEDLAWQPELWRRVLDLVDEEPPDVRQSRVVSALREGALSGLELPGRLSLFGHTRIAGGEVEVISALGEHRDVHLWLPQASPAAWETLVEETSTGPVPRAEDPSGLLVAHPLLASLGRDARELQRTLAVTGAVDVPGGSGPDPTDDPPPTLLQLLQADIAADHAPGDAEREARQVPADDRSIQVHACHGRTRQVEVLRDVLADLLQRDPTLEPRDVLVMCPDIETYAPLFHAGFGLGEVVADRETHPAHRLRVRLADRAPLHTNPLLGLAATLLQLAGGRATVSEVLDLARSAPVRHRFGLDDDALDRMGDWIEAVAVRWGLDSDHRGQFGLHHLPQNTWRAGLDRILVGAAVDGQDTDHLGTVLALDDLDSGDLDLAGRVEELLDRLTTTLRALADADRVEEWIATLREGVLGLADVPVKDAWQTTALEHELARIGAGATRNGTVSLSLSDVHALLAEQAAGRATRSSFRTGTMTVCTMVPMRSVPHRVVALVGLDDGAFPRHTTPDGDDVLARRPVTGERDLRSEDRQLLLDAIMSAGQHLVITCTGFDQHTGQGRPPAVPLGELLDAVRATGSGQGVGRVLTSHPLQPFDVRNLGVTPLDGPGLRADGMPFSYDPTALAGALAQQRAQTRPAALAAASLAPAAREDVGLDDLLRFFDNPARAFLRSRLGLVLPEVPELRGEGIPIELDGLQRWVIGDRVLEAVLDGRDPQATVAAELWRGELPPDTLGRTSLDEICREAQALAEATWRTVGQGGWGRALSWATLDVDVALPGGRRLTGTVPSMVDGHSLTVTYSSLKAKNRMRTWITGLVLAAAGHEGATSHHIAKHSWGRGQKGPALLHYLPQGQDEARELLAQLADVRDRGLDEVLPLPVETSSEWARAYQRSRRERQAHERASQWAWVTRDGGFAKEQDDAAWVRVLGGRVPLADLHGMPREDERWTPGVQTRLGQYALRAWGPLLDGVERLERL